MIEAATLPWYKIPFQFLPWWANILLFVYLCYAVFYRVWYIYRETMDEGFFRGLFDVYIGDEGKPIYDGIGPDRKIIGREPRYIRMYHILWIILDLPCIAIGACFPFIRRVFTVKIAPIQRPSKEDIQ